MNTKLYQLLILFIFLEIFISGCKKNPETDTGIKKDSAQTNKEDKIDDRWKLYYTNADNDKYYYDTKTLEHFDRGELSAERYYIWEKIIFDKEQVFDFNNKDNNYSGAQGKKYKEIKYYKELRCTYKMIKINEYKIFFIDGKVLNAGSFNVEYIAPESSDEILYETLCGDKNQDSK